MCILLSSAAFASVPNVTTTVPQFGVSDVSASAPITATFSEAMDPTSLTATTFNVSQFTGVKAIAAGYGHTLILRNDGTVLALGQATVPTGLNGVDAIAAGEAHSVALKNDGTVVTWGREEDPSNTIIKNRPAGPVGVTAIAAGFGFTLVLKNDGTIDAWGSNGSDQATIPQGLSGVTAIAAGSYHSLALKSDGTVAAWGRNDYGQSQVPAGLSGVVAIAAGWYHSIALKNDGTLVVWGDGLSQAPLPDGVSGLTMVAGGGYHKVGLKSDGTVVAWDYNNYGQTTVPGNLTGVVAVAAGAYHTIAMKDDGTAIAWGRNNYSQATIPANAAITTLPGTVAYNAGSNTATFTPSAPLPAPALLTATISITAKSASGVTLPSEYRWSFITGVSPLHYILTVAIGGTGSGTVHSDAPGNIACSKNAPANCTGNFAGTVVNLTYTPDWKSLFNNWSVDCAGNSVCRPYMDRNRNVTAVFVPNKQTLVNDGNQSGYATLQDAYNGAPVAPPENPSKIQAHEYTFYEDLKLGLDKAVIFDGGKDINDPQYQSITGFTTLQGSLVISAGKLVPSRLIIRAVP